MNETNHANQSPGPARKLRFGTFEVDLDLRELRNRGIRIKVQHKPFQVLEVLLRSPGSLVRREELIQQLWPNLHVNFDGGLNTAVNTLRQVLGDSPRRCRFIETLPGLGYRFLVPVETIVEPERDVGTGHTANFEAQQDYLRAKYFYNKVSEVELRKSIAYFESAIAQDPSFGLAYTGLADAHCLSAFLGTVSAGDACRRANQSIMTALQIASELPEAHASLACIKGLFERDWDGAEAECLHALQMNASCRGAHQAYATLLALTERVEEAVKEIRRAQTLDPLSVLISMQTGWISYVARDFHAAIEQSWKALVLEPTFAAAQHTLGLAYEQTGMIDEAISEFQNARSCSGHHPAAIAALGHAYSRAGKREDARKALAELDEMSRRRYVSPYWKSVVLAGIGANDLAFHLLNECCETNDVWLFMLRIDPRLDPIRGMAQFGRLLKRVRSETPIRG